MKPAAPASAANRIVRPSGNGSPVAAITAKIHSRPEPSTQASTGSTPSRRLFSPAPKSATPQHRAAQMEYAMAATQGIRSTTVCTALPATGPATGRVAAASATDCPAWWTALPCEVDDVGGGVGAGAGVAEPEPPPADPPPVPPPEPPPPVPDGIVPPPPDEGV